MEHNLASDPGGFREVNLGFCFHLKLNVLMLIKFVFNSDQSFFWTANKKYSEINVFSRMLKVGFVNDIILFGSL